MAFNCSLTGRTAVSAAASATAKTNGPQTSSGSSGSRTCCNAVNSLFLGLKTGLRFGHLARGEVLDAFHARGFGQTALQIVPVKQRSIKTQNRL